MENLIEPITRLDQINEDECLNGYRAGLGVTPVDYAQKSASYWHGYQNAMADQRKEPPNPASTSIAREMMVRMRRLLRDDSTAQSVCKT